eukprot:2081187-Prymnesium_polylepis.1
MAIGRGLPLDLRSATMADGSRTSHTSGCVTGRRDEARGRGTRRGLCHAPNLGAVPSQQASSHLK